MRFTAEKLEQFECPHCEHVIDATDLKPLTKTTCVRCGGESQVPASFGQHHLLKSIATDQFGTTFMAYDTMLQRKVALKVLSSESQNVQRTRQFMETARNLAILDNENVVKIYTTGRCHDQQYIEMEWLDGGDANQFIKQSNRLAESEVLIFGLGIADGLKAAWKRGLTHLHVSPATILYDNDSRRPKLSEFGYAPAIATEELEEIEKEATHTPEQNPKQLPYLAPEQIRRETVDWRADIYGLGATLFHMLAGRPPFYGKNAEEFASQQLAPAPQFKALGVNVNRELQRVISRMLSIDPEERHASYEALMGDMGIALDTILDEMRLEEPTPESSGILALAQVMKEEIREEKAEIDRPKPNTRPSTTPNARVKSNRLHHIDDPILLEDDSQRTNYPKLLAISAAAVVAMAATVFLILSAVNGPPPTIVPEHNLTQVRTPIESELQSGSLANITDDPQVADDDGADITIQDFESDSFNQWQPTDSTFYVTNCSEFTGKQGKRYLTSGGSSVTDGKLLGQIYSPLFKISRDYLNFNMSKGTPRSVVTLTRLNGTRLRETRLHPQYNYIKKELRPITWDLKEYKGQTLRIMIKDASPTDFLALDNFILSNTPYTTPTGADFENPGTESKKAIAQIKTQSIELAKGTGLIFQETGDHIVIEAEHPTAVNPKGRGWYLAQTYKGHLGNAHLYASSKSRGTPGYCRYQIDFPEAGRYYAWCRVYGKNGKANSLFIKFNGESKTGKNGLDMNRYNIWQWRRIHLDVPAPGVHQLSTIIREPTTGLDRLVITKEKELSETKLNALKESPRVKPEHARSDPEKNQVQVLKEPDGHITNWQTIRFSGTRSVNGSEIRQNRDGILEVNGKHPDTDVHEFTANINEPLNAIRLDALLHSGTNRLARTKHGNTLLTGFEAEILPLSATDTSKWQPIRFDRVWADHEQKEYPISQSLDGHSTTGWSPAGHLFKKERVAIFYADQTYGDAKGSTLRVRLRYESRIKQHILGRIKLSLNPVSLPPKVAPGLVIRTPLPYISTRKIAELANAEAASFTIAVDFKAEKDLKGELLGFHGSKWTKGGKKIFIDDAIGLNFANLGIKKKRYEADGQKQTLILTRRSDGYHVYLNDRWCFGIATVSFPKGYDDDFKLHLGRNFNGQIDTARYYDFSVDSKTLKLTREDSGKKPIFTWINQSLPATNKRVETKRTPAEVTDPSLKKFVDIKKYGQLDGQRYTLAADDHGLISAISPQSLALQNFTLQAAIPASSLSALLLKVKNQPENKRKSVIKQIKFSLISPDGANQPISISEMKSSYEHRAFPAKSLVKGRPGWSNDGQQNRNQVIAFYLPEVIAVPASSQLRIEMINGLPPRDFSWSFTGHEKPRSLAETIIQSIHSKTAKGESKSATKSDTQSPQKYAPGLIRRYYREKKIKDVMDSSQAHQSIRLTKDLQLNAIPRGEKYALRWDGYIQIKRSGKHTLRGEVDNEVQIYLNDKEVAKFTFANNNVTYSQNIKAGYYKITVLFYQGGGKQSLNLMWQTPGSSKPVPLPADCLFYSPAMAKKLNIKPPAK